MNNDKDILITNIQRFSLYDGPGIRTVCFLKGCSLNCPWCCNPENIKPIIQKYEKNGNIGYYGEYYDSNQLYNELIKDKIYFENQFNIDYNINSLNDYNKLPGGITFSGGEPLLQIEKYSNVLHKLKKDKIHLAIETSLFSNLELLKIAIEYIDLFFVDIKILDEYKCKEIEGGNLDIYLKNLDFLSMSHKPIVFRVPVISDYTFYDENINKIGDLINKYIKNGNIIKVELLKEHNLGSEKSKTLGESFANKINKNVVIFDENMIYYKECLDKKTNGKLHIDVLKI